MPKINRLFQIGSSGRLFSLQYKDGDYLGDKDHELKRFLRNWTDESFMRQYYQQHKLEFQNYKFGHIDESDALYLSCRYAQETREWIAAIANQPSRIVIRSLFEALTSGSSTKSFRPVKIKHRLLRLYAVKLPGDVFVITGGALKLTYRMNERDYLVAETAKNKYVQQQFSRLLANYRPGKNEKDPDKRVLSAVLGGLSSLRFDDDHWPEFCKEVKFLPTYYTGIRVRSHLRDYGLSYTDLARQTLIPEPRLVKLLEGNSPIPRASLRKIEKATGLRLFQPLQDNRIQLKNSGKGEAF